MLILSWNLGSELPHGILLHQGFNHLDSLEGEPLQPWFTHWWGLLCMPMKMELLEELAGRKLTNACQVSMWSLLQLFWTLKRVPSLEFFMNMLTLERAGLFMLLVKWNGSTAKLMTDPKLLVVHNELRHLKDM